MLGGFYNGGVNVIQFQDVSFHYSSSSKRDGVDHINLTIPTGQVVLLCGESGCGKTTLTRLINGLIPNYYEGELVGNVLIDNKDISHAPLYETSRYVGSVFQNPRTQFFTIDTTSELAFGNENLGVPKEEITKRIWEVAKQSGLIDLLGRNIFALSGGEKQKIACGCVSAIGAEIVVLDEPSSNLDALATAELRDMICRWKNQGKTIIIAEHRLYYLKGVIDRVLYMEKGQIIDDLTYEEATGVSVTELIKRGLRPFDLANYPLTENTYDESGEIILSDFEFGYDKRKNLNIKSLSLPQGNIVAIIGHNGAGKSTFARCLCGLERKCKGLVTWKGKQYGRKARLRMCYMVMQDVNHQLFTESIEEEMEISVKEADALQLSSVLERLDLLQYKNSHPMALSGGQKQRVAIATAIVSEREILVFDEPTSGLDLRHMGEVAQILSELCKMGKTILVITHDYELIMNCCSYVLHLEEGEIKEQYKLDKAGYRKLREFFIF